MLVGLGVLLFMLYVNGCLVPEKAILQGENRAPVTFLPLKRYIFLDVIKLSELSVTMPWTTASLELEYVSVATLVSRQAPFQHLVFLLPCLPILRLTFCHEHKALSSIITFGAI